jgi:acyl-coenzyme A thioesterase PaaI-like protein
LRGATRAGELLGDRCISIKLNYLEPIVSGVVTAEASVLRSSRRSAYAEVDVWAGGKLAARASTTYMIRPLAPG